LAWRGRLGSLDDEDGNQRSTKGWTFHKYARRGLADRRTSTEVLSRNVKKPPREIAAALHCPESEPVLIFPLQRGRLADTIRDSEQMRLFLIEDLAFALINFVRRHAPF
jgi:hypothetical protein